MTAAVSKPRVPGETVFGSRQRFNNICRVVNSGTGFAIIHQDACGLVLSRGEKRCTCVPDIWRVDRGQA